MYRLPLTIRIMIEIINKTLISQKAKKWTWPIFFLLMGSFNPSLSNPSVALPTSQLILQTFHCFTNVTAHSPILLSLLARHRLFIYVTWRAAHDFVYIEYAASWFQLQAGYLVMRQTVEWSDVSSGK